MAYPARVFRVLIASPSDVSDERDIAVRALQEWNDLNSAERQIVLLPLRWETHAYPEYGARPQGVINRQVADHCDLVIGIFWTRIGTSTGVSDSGTIEEIERAAQNGKSVMLYFSQARQDPDHIELEQLSRLRDFKKKTLPNSLIESYSTHIEFKDKLTRQLELRVRELLAASGSEQGASPIAKPVTDIRLRLASADGKSEAGEKLSAKTQYFKLLNFDAVPDYVPEDTHADSAQHKNENALFWAPFNGKFNKDYFRQTLTHRTLQLFFIPVGFWLKNVGGIGARDVHIELQIASSGGLVVVGTSRFPKTPPKKTNAGLGLLGSENHPTDPAEVISRTGSYWTTQFDVPALQPQREFVVPTQFLVGSVESCQLSIGATIFADTLPEPIRQVLEIDLNVDVVDINALDLLDGDAESKSEAQERDA